MPQLDVRHDPGLDSIQLSGKLVPYILLRFGAIIASHEGRNPRDLCQKS